MTNPLARTLVTDGPGHKNIGLAAGLTALSLALFSGPVHAQASQQPPKPPAQNTSAQNSSASNPAASVPGGNSLNTTLPPALTLSDAIDYALRLQPQIASAVAQRQEAAERRVGVYSGYYPRVTPTFQYQSQYNYGPVTQFGQNGTISTDKQGVTTTNRNAVLGASFNLFDSGTRELNARQARQSLRVAQFNEANTRQTVISNVADTYFTVLRNEALVRVSEAQVARAQNTLDVVRAQFQAGITAQKDTYQAEADLLNAQVNLLQAQNNAAVARASLKQAIGAVSGADIRLADVVLPDINTPMTATALAKTSPVPNPTTPPPGNSAVSVGDATMINDLAATAYQLRPDIASNRGNVEVQQTSSSIARVATGVQVSGDVAANDNFDAVKFDKSIANDRQIGVTLSYPLFDGGFVRSQFRASQAGARAAQAQLVNLQQQVAVEVEQAYRDLAQARASLPASISAVRAARINYEAAIASRREGVGSVVDVITAQTSLVQAETNYVQAIYSFYAADARLTGAVGQSDKISRIGSTSLNNPSPVQFTDLSADATTPAAP